MENGVSGVPSSTSQQGGAVQSPSQFNTPVAAQLGIRRRAVFNNAPAICIFICVLLIGLFLAPLRTLLAKGTNESGARRVIFWLLEYVSVLTEAVIAKYMNAYRHITVLVVWSTLTFTSFAQLMNDIIGYWQYKNQPDSTKKDGFEGFYFIGYVFFIFYHGIAFLAFSIFLVHVVKVYKEEERLRREEQGLAPP